MCGQDGATVAAAADKEEDARSEEGRVAEGGKADAGDTQAEAAAGEEKGAAGPVADDGAAPMDVDAEAGPAAVRSPPLHTASACVGDVVMSLSVHASCTDSSSIMRSCHVLMELWVGLQWLCDVCSKRLHQRPKPASARRRR